MADFFAPKQRASGRVAPEPGLGSIPENRDAPATLPRQKGDNNFKLKLNKIKTKNPRPGVAPAESSAVPWPVRRCALVTTRDLQNGPRHVSGYRSAQPPLACMC